MSDLEALVKSHLMFVINLCVFFLFKIYCKHLKNYYINNNYLMYILNVIDFYFNI
jgi:hypothetical protein